jgi:hypothetical protein
MGQSHEYEWDDGELVPRDRRDTVPSQSEQRGVTLDDGAIAMLPVPSEEEAFQRALFCRDLFTRLRPHRTCNDSEVWKEARRAWDEKPEDL